MSGVFDWIARVAMLVCAGLVTLSLIGAIAAIPSGPGIDMGLERRGDLPQLPRAGEAPPRPSQA
ncbi:MAG: hypothetical protein ACFBQW_02185, partial [Sphingomonadaceae bacterium]